MLIRILGSQILHNKLQLMQGHGVRERVSFYCVSSIYHKSGPISNQID